MTIYKKLGHEFNRISRAQQKYLKIHLKPYHIGVSEFHFLLHIPDYEGINQQELCTHTHVDKSLATRGINNLLDKNILTRSKSPDNKKTNIIELTDLGRSVKHSTIEVLAQWNIDVACDLSPEELDLFITQLRQMTVRAQALGGNQLE